MSQNTCFSSCYAYLFKSSKNESLSIDVLSTMDNKIKPFTLDGMVFQAKIVDVHDGDTIKAVFKVFDKYYRWNCRIAHVDTPELKTDNAEEKERAIFVRDKVRELLLNKIVTLHCLTFDKYGRLLIEVEVPGTNERLHEWLITNKYANPYEGKTKLKFHSNDEIQHVLNYSQKKRQRNNQEIMNDK